MQNAKEPKMKKERRWMKSALASSETAMPSLPWQRGARRKPEAMKAAAKTKAQAAR